MTGNVFETAIMKTSVISAEFRRRYLSDPAAPDVLDGVVTVFDGPEDYHRRIDDPAEAITAESVLVMRGSGPVGHPGAAEVVNMRPPAYLIKQGITELPCVGDGRQSGTSGSPEAATGGNIALLRNGDRIRIDLIHARVDVALTDQELSERRRALDDAGGYKYPASQTPWQHIQRGLVGELQTGAVLEGTTRFHRIVDTLGLPRDNH